MPVQRHLHGQDIEIYTMTDKVEPNTNYCFSEPFRSHLIRVNAGYKHVPPESIQSRGKTKSKPATPKQIAYLRNMGYSGPVPTYLDEASHLIELQIGYQTKR